MRAAKGAYWPQLSLFGQATAGNQDYFGTAAYIHSLTRQRQEEPVFTALAGVRIDWIFFDTPDLILVMEQGHIVESGRHDELMARSGPYRRLIAAQTGE